jgi:hypothetical protein
MLGWCGRVVMGCPETQSALYYSQHEDYSKGYQTQNFNLEKSEILAVPSLGGNPFAFHGKLRPKMARTCTSHPLSNLREARTCNRELPESKGNGLLRFARTKTTPTSIRVVSFLTMKPLQRNHSGPSRVEPGENRSLCSKNSCPPVMIVWRPVRDPHLFV